MPLIALFSAFKASLSGRFHAAAAFLYPDLTTGLAGVGVFVAILSVGVVLKRTGALKPPANP